MKVLEVNVDDHLYGGVYVLVKSIIQYLPKHIRADVAALEPFDDKNHITELNEYGSEVYYVGSKRNKVLKQIDIYRNIKQLIKEKQYDVVHLHSDVSHKILVSALAARKAPKLVFHAHANDAEGKFLILRRIFHKICCVFLKRIPADYLATSADAGKWMFPWAKKEDVIVLNNGIDYHRFEFDIKKREEKRKELGYRDDEFVIGLFGRFVSPKNPIFAIEILQAILEKDPHIKMLCIGEGPLKQIFIQELEKRNMEENVRILGNTDHIEEYYQAIDALIMPSKFEGFGMVAVESQISGTPTYASVNVPDMTKISDLICYMPTQHEDLDKWRDKILEARSYIKNNVMDRIDKKYELHTLVNKIVSIYQGGNEK